ncbi:MAG: glycosyltransferase [Rhodocyclaceae bacterium]|nr:glycosyltransferase [Rhodocyclaceae bacterium]
MTAAANFQHAGQLQEAERYYLAILDAAPGHGAANHKLGMLMLEQQQATRALPHLRAALEALPEREQYWLDYIQGLIQAGQEEAAGQVFALGERQGVLGSTPTFEKMPSPAHHRTTAKGATPRPGVSGKKSSRTEIFSDQQTAQLMALINEARHAEAETLAVDMTRHFPRLGFGWKVLGTLLLQRGAVAEAIPSLQRAAQLLSADPEAHSNLGVAHEEQGRLADAEASYRRALKIKPDHVQALNNLGDNLRKQGKPADSEASLRRALAINPQYAEALNNLGNTLRDQNKLSDSEANLRRALEIRPDYAEAYINLGNTLQSQCRFQEAEASFRRAQELRPDHATIHNNLGNVLKDLGRLAEAEDSLRRAVQIQPDYTDAYSNLLFTLNYNPAHSPAYCLEEARRYGLACAHRTGSRFSSWLCADRPARLRIGFISGDFRNHPVGYFLENLLAHIDPSRLELMAYHTHPQQDDLTARLRSYFQAWKSLYGKSDEEAARLVHADGIHILIDLSGHTGSNRLPVFSWKPAPLQVSWLGYFATTGMAEMDYLLADKNSLPEDDQRFFTETIWYLPDTRLCFTPPQCSLPVSPLPALSNGCVTFGCFQNMAKVGNSVLETWRNILDAMPSARLRWQCKQLGDPETGALVAQQLYNRGIDPARVSLHGSVTRLSYLAAHSEVDLILDTFPYPGGTTTCEALWMGVPTLTLAGDSLLSRQGASLLTAAGMGEWIAKNEADYVDKAIAHAADVPRLADTRTGLRAKVLASPLFDAPRFARNFEAAMWEMWKLRQS